MMTLFLLHLTKILDSETPDWKDSTIILFDNASYHRSQETKVVLKKLDLKVIYSGPYAFSASAIELLFGSLKVGEINPESQTTSKR